MSHIFGTVGISDITDVNDTDKVLGINLSSANTATRTTMNFSQTADRVWNWPDGSSTVLGTDLTQTVSGKTIYEPTNPSVVASGTNQGTAAALSSMYNIITTAASGTGVVLPTPIASGLRCVIVNRGANIVNIYPHVGATINALAVNTPITLGVNGSISLQTSSTTAWYTGNNLVAPSQLPANVISDTLVADQNNYNPTGLSTATQIRLTASGATRTVTGLQNFGTELVPVLSEVFITNVGATNNVVFAHESTSSTAANRLAFDGQDIVLLPGQSFSVFYDFTSSRWRAMGMSQDGRVGGAVVIAGVITPSTLTVSQNDYNPPGLNNATVIRLSATTGVNITGISGGVNGRQLNLLNVSSQPITLQSNSSLSSATNRFDLGSGNLTLIGSSVVIVIYDSLVGRWRALGGTGGTAAGGLIQSQWVEVETDRSTTATTWPTPNTVTKNTVVNLPQATIPVVSAAAFPTSGSFYISLQTGGYAVVSYTGKTGGNPNTFTGCTGGTGVVPIGAKIWLVPTSTTVAAGSNGAALPQATINVASTASFPTSGVFLIATSGGNASVTYTGTTATTFTGCSGGVGTLSTGGVVTDVSPHPQDILTISLNTNGGALILNSTISASNETNNASVLFHLLLDGVVLRGSGTSGNGSAPGGSSVIGIKISGIAAGAHFIAIRWRVSSGTGIIFPVTNAEVNNGSLLVQEVSS